MWRPETLVLFQGLQGESPEVVPVWSGALRDEKYFFSDWREQNAGLVEDVTEGIAPGGCVRF